MLDAGRPSEACPYLGLFDDPRSHFTFPTEGHRCHAGGRPVQIEPEYQDAYCLSTRYPACERFHSAEAAARRRSGVPAAVATAPVAPAAVATSTMAPATAKAAPQRDPGARWGWVLLRFLAALVLLALAVAIGLGAFGKHPGDGGASGGVGSPSPAATASPTALLSVSTTPSPASTDTPAPTPIVHVVAPGETLSSIAQTYGVTVQAIQDANNIDNASLIRTGQRLIIPAAP